MNLDDVGRAATALRQGFDTAWWAASFWGPVANVPNPVRVIATIGSLLALVATTGLALTSLAMLFTSLLFLYLLLTRVFGVELAVELPR